MSGLFNRITQQMEQRCHGADNEFELHISIVGGYYSNLYTTCDFLEPPSAQLLLTDEWEPQILISFMQELKEMFVVPRLNNFHQAQNRISKSHLLEAFISLLLQLLYHRTDDIVDPFKDLIDNLEKELRFLLTILGDISWMGCDTHDHGAEFKNLMAEFGALANQAGNFVHHLFFYAEASEEMGEGFSAVLKHTVDLLKANLQSFVSIPAYTTPTTSIINSVLILNSLVDDLEHLLKREDDSIADVKEQLKLLHQELLLSHSLIKGMRLPQPSEIEEVKEALMRIGGIAYQVEYLITSFLVKDAPLWYVINRLTDLNHRIEIVRTELQVITLKYQFRGLKVEKCNFRAEPLLQDKKFHDVTVGFDDKTTEILDQLVGGGTESLTIISILGMPGHGKTTLAKKLYNHPLVNYTFDKLSWCVVSQTYKRQHILANVLIHINIELDKDSISEMEEQILVQNIHKTLMRRRYLIVLDDMWDSNVFDELIRCFPDDGNGSRILLTSRNRDVAPHSSIKHELEFFSDEQCWELLEMKTFGSQTCPPELQGIGKKIAARCCGLPLTVVAIAGVLSTVEDKERTWEEVEGSIASHTDNLVMQILGLSYKHLPDHLKPCFLYFGEFKEDEEIYVGNLKRLWVAEGFIHKEDDKSAENIAGEYLRELIDRSLVMIVRRRTDGRGAKSCVVHDLMRDLCMKKSKEECILKYWNNNYLHTNSEKSHRIRAYGETSTLSNCQHVRSFVGDDLSQSFYVRDMRLLRVLHFKENYQDHIFGIEYLVNLRSLVIFNFPIWIERLVNLEYLRVEKVGTYLPPAIMKMKRLRYLHAASAEYGEDWKMNKLRNEANNLESLSGVIVKELEDEELLKCSPHLRNLKCCYDVDERDEKRACPRFDLRFLTQLHSLSLNGILMRGDFGFPSNIRKLTLFGSHLHWENMSIVGRLEFLEVLILEDYAFLEERWGTRQIWDTRDGEFQKLKFLQLYFQQLCEWNVASNEHFPKLQQLILSYCENLEEISSEIGEITTLQLIEVEGHCQSTLVESAERIKEEQREMGNEELSVIICDVNVLGRF